MGEKKAGGGSQIENQMGVSVGRAPALQAGGQEFESSSPLT